MEHKRQEVGLREAPKRPEQPANTIMRPGYAGHWFGVRLRHDQAAREVFVQVVITDTPTGDHLYALDAAGLVFASSKTNLDEWLVVAHYNAVIQLTEVL